MKIYFLRHGQTDWNIQFKLQGISDIELNENGVKQAYGAADKLLDIKIDFIICSPLKRTKKTVDIINENRNIPVIYDERICERSFGIYEGTDKNEFDYEGFWDYQKNLQYVNENVENIRSFFDRVYEFIEEIKPKYLNKTVLIVAHSGVARAFKCYFEGMPEDGKLVSLRTENTEILEYEFK